MTLVDRYADELSDAMTAGVSLPDAMRDLAVRHAAILLELGPVAVMALDACPGCDGRVLADDTVAMCGCGWSYRGPA